MRRQSRPITPHEKWLELFWNVYFLRAVFRFRFIACISWNTKLSWAFYLPPFEYFTKAGFSWRPRSEKTLSTCFVLSARTTKFYYYYYDVLPTLIWNKNAYKKYKSRTIYICILHHSSFGFTVMCTFFIQNIDYNLLNQHNCTQKLYKVYFF